MASGSSQQISRVAVGAVVLLAALGADATRVLHAARPVVVAFADRAAEIELTDGDLVFRRGRDLVSRLVLSQGDAPRFSHVGVSVRIGGSTFVIHAVPADGASPGGVVLEPLARFAASTGAVDLGAYRVRGLTPVARAKVRDYALRQVGKPFDDAFSMRDDQRMYCTELVLKALTAGGVEITPTVPSLRVPLLAEPVVPPDHLRLSPLLEPLVPRAGIQSTLAAPAATIAHR